MEVSEVLKAKIVFLIERDTIGAVKFELDAIRNIDGVKNVHLAYYSLEGTDEDSAAGDSA
jgi:nitrate reductase NapAB chaperone NapD